MSDAKISSTVHSDRTPAHHPDRGEARAAAAISSGTNGAGGSVSTSFSRGGSVYDAFRKSVLPAPPNIEKGFLSHLSGDVSTILNTPNLWLLTAGALAGGVGLGANDFANAMGTTVGSQVLTFGQARMVAGAATLYGATFGGQKTAESVKSNVWDVRETNLSATDTQNGMAAALIGSGLWIAIATRLGYPISTTQSTVGGLIGVGAIADAFKTNDSSRLFAGVKTDKLKEYGLSWLTSPTAGLAGGAAIYGLGLRWIYHLTEFRPAIARIWQVLPVLSGALVAYGIGGNDTGHIIGPLAGGIDADRIAGKGMAERSRVNQWLNALGAWFIITGMWNWGAKVTDTLGSKMGGMNPAKAVSAELATYLVVNYFRSKGIPISSSHTVVGSVVGVTVGSGKIPPPFFLGRIAGAWLWSIPVSALFAGAGYAAWTSVSSVNRSAPARDSHDLGPSEDVAIALMRADRSVAFAASFIVRNGGKDFVRRFARIARRLPLGALGFGLLARAVSKASKEGPVYASTEATKAAVELIPGIGGAVQAADGFHELHDGSSYLTNLKSTRGDAIADVVIGVVSAVLAAVKLSRKLRSWFDRRKSVKKTRPLWLKASRVLFGRRAAQWLEVKAAEENRTESARQERGEFIRKTNEDAVTAVAKSTGIGRSRLFIIYDALMSHMQREGKRLMHEAAVRIYADNLLRKIEGEVFEGRIRPEAADSARAALSRALPQAVAKKIPTIIGKAVRQEIDGDPATREVVSRAVRYVRKLTPEGFAVLDTAQDQRVTIEKFLARIEREYGAERAQSIERMLLKGSPREYYERGMMEAAERIAQQYKDHPWRLALRTAWTGFVETVFMGLPIRLAGVALKKIPFIRRAAGAVADAGRDWFRTILPFGPLKRLFERHIDDDDGNASPSGSAALAAGIETAASHGVPIGTAGIGVSSAVVAPAVLAMPIMPLMPVAPPVML